MVNTPPPLPPSGEPAPSERPHRAWSVYIGSVAGIPIFLHMTLLLLLGVFVWIQIVNRQPLDGIVFVVAIFGSIALHELGHALMARRFGIKTDDIVLYPIGGVARLRGMGQGMQEFWIAIAGPAVNVLIAVLLFLYLALTGGLPDIPEEMTAEHAMELPLAYKIMGLNIVLLLFNMVPAFPMDGGRVLRALMTPRLGLVRATQIASRIGQAFAVLFIVAGMLGYGNGFMLMLIGLFVFFAAAQENAATQSAALTRGRRVREAMITRFETLSHADTLGRAVDLLLATSQRDFPVLAGGEVSGLLTSQDLIKGLATHGRDHYVAEVMNRDFARLSPDDELVRYMELMPEIAGASALVFEGDRLMGYINRENLAEYLMIAGIDRPV